jgi:hypothetical protein
MQRLNRMLILVKEAVEEKSTPETLTTACQAVSWLARS